MEGLSGNQVYQPCNTGPGRPSWTRHVLGYVIVVLFVLLCAHYAWVHRAEFSFLVSVSLLDTVLASFLVSGVYLIGAYQISLFLKGLGLQLGAMELGALTMSMCLGNLVTPMRGGSGALAIYLKKVHNLEFSSYAMMFGGTGLLVTLINSGLALGGLAVLYVGFGYFEPVVTIPVVGLFVVCLYLTLFPPVLGRQGGILGFVSDAVNSWRIITQDRGLLIRLTVSFLAAALAMTGSFWLIYRALGSPLSLPAVLITSSLGNIANLIGLTPGSVGFFDIVVIQIPLLFDLDPARALTAAVLYRLLSFVWALLLGIPGLVYVLVRIRKFKTDVGPI